MYKNIGNNKKKPFLHIRYNSSCLLLKKFMYVKKN